MEMSRPREPLLDLIRELPKRVFVLLIKRLAAF